MAFNALTHVSAGSTDGVNVTTSAIDTSGANLLIAVLVNSTASTPVVTDSKSNVWTPLTASSAAVTCRIFYTVPTSIGSGHTFSILSGNAPTICVAAFSGGKTLSPFDQENGAAGATPGSVTPTDNRELVIAALSHSTAGTPTISGGFTVHESVQFVGGQHFGGGLAYLIQTTASAANPTWTIGTPNDSTIATFKASSVASMFAVL